MGRAALFSSGGAPAPGSFVPTHKRLKKSIFAAS
jgi:hypothetical protein